MADVFISYAREDQQRATQIAHGLQAAGLDVFWDNQIPPGSTWADYIETKLAGCKAAVVLWSAHSVKSQWVREEARMGRDRGNLIPAMIDTVPAPFGFGEVQAADLANWSGQGDHPEWRRFVSAVKNVVGAPAQAASPPMPATPRTAPAPASAPPQAPRMAMQVPAQLQGMAKKVPMWAWVSGAGVGGLVLIVALASSLLSDDSGLSTPPQMAAAGSMGPPSAEAAPVQNPEPGGGTPQQVILAQLGQAQSAFAQQGFQQLGQPATGGLAQGQTFNQPVDLYAGYEYRVLGVCDADCADLDITLYDANGQVVLQDTSTDAHPTLTLRPNYTARYTVQINMFNCTVAPCYYALALYGRQPAAGAG